MRFMTTVISTVVLFTIVGLLVPAGVVGLSVSEGDHEIGNENHGSVSDDTIKKFLESESAFATDQSVNSPNDPHVTLPAIGVSEIAFVFVAYSRYNEVSPLENELREEIFELVSDSPGIAMAVLVRRTNRPRSTLRYHTRILTEENYLRQSKIWGQVRFFPVSLEQTEYERYAAVHESSLRQILSVVNRYEPIAVSTIAEKLDRKPSTISHHLSRLANADLIVRERAGANVRLRLAEDVREFLKSAPGDRKPAVAIGD